MPATAEEATITTYQTTSGATTGLYVRDGGDVTHLFKIGAQYIPENFTLRQIENAMIKMQENAGAYTFILYPSSYRIEW